MYKSTQVGGVDNYTSGMCYCVYITIYQTAMRQKYKTIRVIFSVWRRFEVAVGKRKRKGERATIGGLVAELSKTL